MEETNLGEQITLDEYISSFLTDLETEIQAEVPDTENCERLNRTETALAKLVEDRENTVGSVLDEVGDRDGRDDFAYYSAAMQASLNALYRATENAKVEKKRALPIVSRCDPHSLSVMNTRMTQFIFDPVKCEMLENPIDIGLQNPDKMHRKKSERYVKSVQCLQIIDGKDLPAKVGFFDLAVLSAICTLYDDFIKKEEKNEFVVTPQMIYRCFSGKSASAPIQLNDVVKSIRKMMTTLVSFDWREHAVSKKLLAEEDFEKNEKKQELCNRASKYAVRRRGNGVHKRRGSTGVSAVENAGTL